jgi:LysM repeat protein
VADWRRYAGPAAFLLAVTVAVLLVRNGLEHGGTTATPATVATTFPSASSGTTTLTFTKKAKPKRRYWTVSAGDTFAVISSKTGVPVATIEQLNPTVKSTSLFIGEKLRVE